MKRRCVHRIKVAKRLGARHSRRPRHPRARAVDDEELFIIEGSPGAQLRDNRRSAKNAAKCG